MSLQSKITPHCAVQSEPSSYEKVQSELASLIQSEVFYLLLFFFTLFFFFHIIHLVFVLCLYNGSRISSSSFRHTAHPVNVLIFGM